MKVNKENKLVIKEPQKRSTKLIGSTIAGSNQDIPGSDFSIGYPVYSILKDYNYDKRKYELTPVFLGHVIEIRMSAKISSKEDVLMFQKMTVQDQSKYFLVKIGYQSSYPWSICFHSQEEAEEYIKKIESGEIKNRVLTY